MRSRNLFKARNLVDQFHSKKVSELLTRRFQRIPCYKEAAVCGYIRVFTREDLLDEKLIHSIKRWREQNKDSFFSLFEVTTVGTKNWLEKSFLNSEKRILFLVEDLCGRAIGHIGLSNVDYQKGEAEIDSVLRGEKSEVSGFFKIACSSLLQWSAVNFALKYYYLLVFSDNNKAVSLYESLGFKEKERHDSMIIQEKGIIRYVPIKDNVQSEVIERSDRVILKLHLEI